MSLEHVEGVVFRLQRLSSFAATNAHFTEKHLGELNMELSNACSQLLADLKAEREKQNRATSEPALPNLGCATTRELLAELLARAALGGYETHRTINQD